MHWCTFERRVASHDANINAALIGMAAKLGLLHEELGVIDGQMERRRQR